MDQPLSAAQAIDRAVEIEAATHKFRRDRVSVSSIGTCARKVTAQALGMIANDFPWENSEGGHLLEDAAGRRLAQVHDIEEQVSVPTSIDGTWTHPDVLIVLASERVDIGGRVLERLCSAIGVQTKSTKRRSIREHLNDVQTSFSLPRQSNVDQVLLEWWFWRKAGFCLTRDKRKILGVPERYELLYLAKEDFGLTRASIEVRWNETRARQLADEFTRRAEALAWGELPDCTKEKPDFECAYTPKWYDFDGTHLETPQVCGLYKNCWGAEYAPPPPKQNWSKRTV